MIVKDIDFSIHKWMLIYYNDKPFQKIGVFNPWNTYPSMKLDREEWPNLAVPRVGDARYIQFV